MTPNRFEEPRYAVLAEGWFGSVHAKTAHGVVRYAPDSVAAVIDSTLAGKVARDLFPDLSPVPLVASLDEALTHNPNALLVGLAPPGGLLPAAWRRQVIEALERGLNVAAGLHEILAADRDFRDAAERGGAVIWDVRMPPADIPLFSGKAWGLSGKVVHTVGTDCAVGKMTAALELTRAAEEAGARAVFVPTGQTGILIAGWGIAVDRVISDFVAGAAEQLVLEGARRGDLLIVEGQGSLTHPAYSGVALGLLHGCAPDSLVLCHDAARGSIENFPALDIPALPSLIRLYEEACRPVKRATAVGIVLGTAGLSEIEAERALAEAAESTGLPAADPLRYGRESLQPLVSAITRES